MGEPTSPDEALARFVAETSIEDVPDRAVRSTERAFVDTVGVTLPGMDEPASRAAESVFGAGEGAVGSAHVLGSGAETSPADAALVNATAGHALDYDDVTGNAWHPSVTLVAPIVAVGERVDATGSGLVTAYAVGFEAEARIAGLVQPAHYERGWHATATFGTIGATAACAWLLDLDAPSVRNALNLAASLPAGLKKNFGSETKPLHAGFAARNGVTAAHLAAEGTTAADGALGGEGGFCDLYGGESNGPEAPVTLNGLGDPWSLVVDGISVKQYPCCYYTHPAIAATQFLTEEYSLGPGDVDRISVTISPGAADALHYVNPETGLEAKFSMEYAVAAAVARERVGLATFTTDAVGDPLVQTVREKVSVSLDDSLGYDTFETVVEVITGDGAHYRQRRSEPPGTPANPLDDEELRVKFEGAIAHADTKIDSEQAYDLLDSVRELESIDNLLGALSGSGDR